jgi:hypothetical protein
MKTVYLHIGAPKTGTTAIQNFCRANHAALAERDVWFPVHLRNHHILLYDVIGRPDAAPNSFDALLTEFACSRFSRLLISAESFFLRVARMNAQRLPASLSKFRLVVICYVRRSDEYMTSLYQTNVRGLARSTQSALEFVRERPPGYAMRLSRIDDLFRPGKFIVGSYDAVKNNLLRDFFSIVGVTDAGLCGSFPTGHVNARLSARQILFLRRLNELRIDQRLFASIGRALRAKRDTDQSHLLPAACRRRLVVQFNTEIDALNRKFGCALHPVPVPCDDQQATSDLTCEDIAALMNSLREHMGGRAMLKLEAELTCGAEKTT